MTHPEACKRCGRIVGPPKTGAGIRVIHVPPALLDSVRAHLLAHAGLGANGLLFPGAKECHRDDVRTPFHKAREAAGRPDLTIHGLRHTALTLAGQHGATAAELQHRAGHADMAAMAIYQHATLERDRLLAEKLSETITARRNPRI